MVCLSKMFEILEVLMFVRSNQVFIGLQNFVFNFGVFLLVLLVSRPEFVYADLIPYSTRSAFDTAASSPVSVIDFEAFPTSSMMSGDSLGGVTFNYSLGSINLKVIDSLPGTSGTKSLGTDDFDRLQDGDIINLSFAARSGFGLYVISSDALLNGDVGLKVNGIEALLDNSTPPISLGGGRSAWFVGLQSNDGSTFSTALLSTYGGGGAFNFNLDDIASVTAVPEPSSVSLLALIAVGCCRLRIRKK
jgi:hypothetical protein